MAKKNVKAKAKKPAKATKPKKAAAKAKPKAKKAKAPVKKSAPKKAAKASKKPVAKKVSSKSKPAPKKAKAPAKKVARAFLPAKSAAKKSGPKSASVSGAKKKSQTKVEKISKSMPLKSSLVVEKIKPVKAVDAPPPAPPAKKAKFKADELRKMREALHHERQRLIEEIRALDGQAMIPEGQEENGGQQPGFSLQLADSASDNMQVETALGIRSIEAEQLVQIDDALRAIQRGEYGICNRCGEPISIQRLLVKPMAKYCVPCLRLLESGKA